MKNNYVINERENFLIFLFSFCINLLNIQIKREKLHRSKCLISFNKKSTKFNQLKITLII